MNEIDMKDEAITLAQIQTAFLFEFDSANY